MKEKMLHTHPMMEILLNLPSDKVIVDRDFTGYFKSWGVIPGVENHIIVDKKAFENRLRKKILLKNDDELQKAARFERERILAEIKDEYPKFCHGKPSSFPERLGRI